MISSTELARLKEICEKAKSGPWTPLEDYSNFVSEARTWLPKLIEEVDRLNKIKDLKKERDAFVSFIESRSRNDSSF